MSLLDPRVQLAWLTAVVLGLLFGRDAGLVAGTSAALGAVIATRAIHPWLRVLRALVPLALVIVALDFLAGQAGSGLRAAWRLVALATTGFAFAQLADGEALIAALQSLRVPYAVTFVLVAGARYVPATIGDIVSLRDAARLRGVPLDGPLWRQLAGWRRLLVPLLVGTIRRGLQLGEAMEARAFGANCHRTSRIRLRWRTRDSVSLAAAVGFLAGVLALGH